RSYSIDRAAYRVARRVPAPAEWTIAAVRGSHRLCQENYRRANRTNGPSWRRLGRSNGNNGGLDSHLGRLNSRLGRANTRHGRSDGRLSRSESTAGQPNGING